MSKLKLYYAHSKLIYNTELENEQLKLIKKQFPKYEIINPNDEIFVINGFKAFLNMVEGCNIVVFTSMDNFVGKGVFTEVEHALRCGISVFWMNNDKFHDNFKISINDPDDWKFKFGEVKICK